MIALARERVDPRYIELLRELPSTDEVEAQYAFYCRIETLLSADAAVVRPAADPKPAPAAGPGLNVDYEGFLRLRELRPKPADVQRVFEMSTVGLEASRDAGGVLESHELRYRRRHSSPDK
jgi:hypothetical protein